MTFLYFIPNVKKKWDDNWPLPSIFFGYVIYPKPYTIQAKGLFGMTTGFDLVIIPLITINIINISNMNTINNVYY